MEATNQYTSYPVESLNALKLYHINGKMYPMDSQPSDYRPMAQPYENPNAFIRNENFINAAQGMNGISRGANFLMNSQGMSIKSKVQLMPSYLPYMQSQIVSNNGSMFQQQQRKGTQLQSHPQQQPNVQLQSPPQSPPPTPARRCGTFIPKRVFVGGISYNTSETDLRAVFSQYGKVKSIKIIVDRAGVNKGYGFVTFETEEEAQRLQNFGKYLFLRDRKLSIGPAIKRQMMSVNENVNPTLVPKSNLNNVSGSIGGFPYYGRFMSSCLNPAEQMMQPIQSRQSAAPFKYYQQTAFKVPCFM